MKFVILLLGALALVTIKAVEPNIPPRPPRKAPSKVLTLEFSAYDVIDRAIAEKTDGEEHLWWEECMYWVMRNDVLTIEIDPISETARVVKPIYRDGFSDYKANRKKRGETSLKDLLK